MQLPPEAVAAICRHMDEDHRDDALLIVRRLGGSPEAVHVRTVAVDGRGIRFEVRDGGGAAREVTVPFASPVTERAQVRAAVVELYERASSR